MNSDSGLKIYILGFIPKKITGGILKNYFNTQLELEEKNFIVYNPLVNMVNSKITYEEAYRRNLRELISSDAVYLIFESSHNFSKSEELRIALKSNKLILHRTLIV